MNYITEEMVVTKLNERGVKAKIVEVVKNGIKLKGIAITEYSETLCPTFYLMDLLKECTDENEIINYIMKMSKSTPSESVQKLGSLLQDKAFIKKNIYYGLQKKNNIDDLVKTDCFFEDVEKFLYLALSCIDNDIQVVKFPNEFLNIIDIDIDELWKIAEKNVEDSFIIRECFGFVTVTNKLHVYGASSGCCVNKIKEIAKKMNVNKFYLIPSSTEEMIIFPYLSFIKEKDIINIIDTINKDSNVIKETEVLGNKPYFVEI